MRQKTSLEIFFNLGGDGTQGGGGLVYTLPTWVYSSIPIDINVVQSVVVSPS